MRQLFNIPVVLYVPVCMKQRQFIRNKAAILAFQLKVYTKAFPVKHTQFQTCIVTFMSVNAIKHNFKHLQVNNGIFLFD